MRLNVLLAGTAVAAAACLATAAQAASFPGFGADATPISPANGPGFIINLLPGNTATVTAVAGQSPTYDGGAFGVGDDTYIGVTNNSGAKIGSINISSTSNPIFGFDSDGIDTFGAGSNAKDTTGYGGPQAYFTNIVGNSGTVNFIGGIANGGSGYFSLESAIDAASFTGPITTGGGVPEPSAWAMLLVGFGAIGATLRGVRLGRSQAMCA